MIKFFSDNLVEQATITASNENSLFPVSNLTHPFRTKVFRSTTNSDSIVFDFLETSAIDSVILVDEPREGFGFTAVTLELNGTNTWGAPAYSTALTINSVHGIAKAEFTTKNYRFARLVFTSTLGYCEVSKVFIGEAISFESGVGIDLGWSYQDKDLSLVKENSYSQKFIDLKTRQKQISFALRTLNPTELDQVFEIYDTKGINKPLFMTLGNDEMINDEDRFAGMYFLNAVPAITNKSFGLYDLSMTLEEAM